MSADVIAWLRSPAGEQWSRAAHSGGPAEVAVQPPAQWHPGGLLHAKDDPCGAGPIPGGAR